MSKAAYPRRHRNAPAQGPGTSPLTTRSAPSHDASRRNDRPWPGRLRRARRIRRRSPRCEVLGTADPAAGPRARSNGRRAGSASRSSRGARRPGNRAPCGNGSRAATSARRRSAIRLSNGERSVVRGSQAARHTSRWAYQSPGSASIATGRAIPSAASAESARSDPRARTPSNARPSASAVAMPFASQLLVDESAR